MCSRSASVTKNKQKNRFFFIIVYLRKLLLLEFYSVGDLFPWITYQEYTIKLKQIINLECIYRCHQDTVTLLKISLNKIKIVARLHTSGSIMFLIIIIIMIHF